MKNDGSSSDGVARAAHDIATTVLELTNTPNVHRVELLSLAYELIGGERNAALLWLWEEQWRFLALNRYASNVTDDPAPPKLLDQVAYRLVEGEDCPSDPSCWALGKNYQTSVAQWARRHGFADHEAILPVIVDQRVAGQKPRAVAFVQLLSSIPISAEVLRSAEIVCGGMALLLTHSRAARRLDAVQELLQAEQRGKQINDWLELAAGKLINITNAEAAMMFREVPGGYEAVVTRGRSKPTARAIASKVSVVSYVARRRAPVRLRHFADDHERAAAFGTVEHELDVHRVMEAIVDGPVRSVLLAPIVFEKHTLAVIALVNKKASVDLARIFSKTDEEVLQNVCGFLKGVLPSVELYEALGAMARVVSPKTLESREEAEKVYNVLRKMIPAITGVGLIRRHRAETTYSIDMFGGTLSITDPPTLVPSVGWFIPTGNPDEGYHYTTLMIPELTDHFLTVELKRAETTGYENQILMFFTRALSHILLAEQGRADVIETFAQLRHAVRTGITGVVGYVSESLGCFDLYRQLDYAPSVLSQARFRKALERANFAAKKSAHLLEESRFLLSNITSESLKLVEQPVTVALVSMLNTLKPFAEERHVEFRFNNILQRGSDRAEIDRSLVEMMIFNVVDNAIKYSYRNKPLHVTLAGTRNDWEVIVTDIGVPIHEGDMEVIFLPFTRRPTGLAAEKRPGTGLGLTVARSIARAHGGDITCSSAPIAHDAAETTFVIKLPRHKRRAE